MPGMRLQREKRTTATVTPQGGFGSRVRCKKRTRSGEGGVVWGGREGLGMRRKRRRGEAEWLTIWTSRGHQGEAYDQTSSPQTGCVC